MVGEVESLGLCLEFNCRYIIGVHFILLYILFDINGRQVRPLLIGDLPVQHARLYLPLDLIINLFLQLLHLQHETLLPLPLPLLLILQLLLLLQLIIVIDNLFPDLLFLLLHDIIEYIIGLVHAALGPVLLILLCHLLVIHLGVLMLVVVYYLGGIDLAYFLVPLGQLYFLLALPIIIEVPLNDFLFLL